MDQLEKKIKYNELLSIYQNMLSDTQKQIMIDYFECDLSISEIAENNNVSRAAVEDAIQKGCQKLDKFEQNIGVLQRYHLLIEKISSLKTSSNLNKDIDEILEGIK